MKKLFLSLPFVVCLTHAHAATRPAYSAKYEDVNCAVNGIQCTHGEAWAGTVAGDGDIIRVPPAPSGVTWTQILNITHAINLIGATTCSTAGIFGAANSGVANDQTVIIDGGRNSQVIAVTLNTNATFRLSGFTFQQGASGTGNSLQSSVNVGGSGPGGTSAGSFRIDNCHWRPVNRNVELKSADASWLYGVIDHCIFDASSIFPPMAIRLDHGTYGGNSDGFGDGSWTDGPHFGSNQFIFIEDCVFNNNSTNGTTGGVDAKYGARFVLRHSWGNNAVFPSPHGTEGLRPRGTRVVEVYNNTINYTFDFPSGSDFRSGTGVVHDNAYINKCHGLGNMQAYRIFHNFGPPYGQATGRNAWDLNDGAGHLLVALDQPCRGRGTLISGANPTPAWPNNAREPIYAWNNTVQNPANPNSAKIGPDGGLKVVEGTDYFNSAMPGYTPAPYPHPLVNPTPKPGGVLNLVPNPGFEAAGSWSTSGAAGRINLNPHTGAYSMRATSGNDGAWQDLPVTPNKTYTLTAWGKKDSTLGYLMIYVKNYGGSQQYYLFTSTLYSQGSITFTPTTSTCEIGVWAIDGSGYGYADDFALISN